MLRILLTGGGSGGHIYPLIAVAEELKKEASQRFIGLELQFVGDYKSSYVITQESDIGFSGVLSPKWRRYASIQNFVDVLKAPIGFLQTLFYLWWFMPDLIFSKGGYDSFLPALVGRLLMIPIALHESDAIPGKANLWAGKWAKKVFVAFEGVKQNFKPDTVKLVGNPLREGVLVQPDRASALNAFGLKPDKPSVLITGASQGAQIINKNLLLAITELVKNFQIIHQCGPNNYQETNSEILKIVKEGAVTYGKTIIENYRLYPLFNLREMATAYAAADVIVSRSGAGSIFEIASVGKPAVLIPLKGSASDHQLANAREFAKFGAIVIDENNLTPHILINEIKNAYENREAITPQIKQFARPFAAKNIASRLLEILKPSIS